MDDILPSLAMGLGLVQLYDQVRSVKDIDVNLKNTITLSIITSILWFTYQYRKYGLNMTTLYTSAGLVVQLYVLNAILLKEKDRILSSNERSD
jgi:hypothetical protein